MSTTPPPASAASRSSGDRAASYRVLERAAQQQERRTRRARGTPRPPRSDSAATQSLLGHGFAVMPVVSEIDGSLAGANFG